MYTVNQSGQNPVHCFLNNNFPVKDVSLYVFVFTAQLEMKSSDIFC